MVYLHRYHLQVVHVGWNRSQKTVSNLQLLDALDCGIKNPTTTVLPTLPRPSQQCPTVARYNCSKALNSPPRIQLHLQRQLMMLRCSTIWTSLLLLYSQAPRRTQPTTKFNNRSAHSLSPSQHESGSPRNLIPLPLPPIHSVLKRPDVLLLRPCDQVPA
jgi:hypothetical protein